MTVQDLLDQIAADGTAVATDQAKITADQATQTLDDGTFVTALTAAGIPAFSIVSADGTSVATYTVAPSAVPPYTEVTTPTASAIVITSPPPPASQSRKGKMISFKKHK
jgi:hypothetical protein